MKFIDYFFYKYYCKLIKIQGNDSYAHVYAYIGLAVLFTLNVLSILFLNGYQISVVIGLLVFVLFIFIFYFLFINNDRYLSVYTRYIADDSFPILGGILVECYILGTIILAIYSAWYFRKNFSEAVSHFCFSLN